MARFSWVVSLMLLVGCSSVYPANDFSVAPCGPNMQHWQAPPPCSRGIIACIGECAADSTCEADCYTRDAGCAACVINEAVLCFRESGCESEYENFTCCAEEKGCALDDEACLSGGCSQETEGLMTCQTEGGSICDQPVLEACFARR